MAFAVFGDVLTTPHTVVTDTSVTAKSMSFDSAVGYAIAGQGEVHLAANIGDAKIEVTKGHHDFQTRAVLDSNTMVDVASGATLEFNHRLSLGGNTLTKTGGGTLMINNSLNFGGGSIIASQGVVGGGGTIGGDVTNDGGTISPGNSRLPVESQVPEPAALVLLVIGIALVFLRRP